MTACRMPCSTAMAGCSPRSRATPRPVSCWSASSASGGPCRAPTWPGCSGTGRAARRDALRLALAAVVTLGLARAALAAPATKAEVWSDPSCGCCEGWVRHMPSAGFDVTVREVADVRPVKVARGVPEALWSCHTAVVDGYVVEGHVPAADIRRLLAERPHAKGLSAPGMPPSSPGMGIPGTPYEVVAFGAA